MGAAVAVTTRQLPVGSCNVSIRAVMGNSSHFGNNHQRQRRSFQCDLRRFGSVPGYTEEYIKKIDTTFSDADESGTFSFTLTVEL